MQVFPADDAWAAHEGSFLKGVETHEEEPR